MYNMRETPIFNDIHPLLKNFKGNFGLWFNKFISLSYNSKKEAYIIGGNDVEFYKEIYGKVSNFAKENLEKKHLSQALFCETYKNKYEGIVIQAQLQSNLITGIGQSHPTEIGMTFDHTMGLPYIPASTIKGIVRLAHILNYLEKNQDIIQDKEKIDLSAEIDIPNIFGGDKKEKNKITTFRGSIIFLDAYPENVPKLAIDIMNPHYGDYYKESKPPSDYLTPVPIKFLTVAKGTKFIFRVLIPKNEKELKKVVISSLKKALTEEGIGAKTAVGYGIFKIINWKEPETILRKIEEEREKQRKLELERQKQEEEKKLANMSEADRICYQLKNKGDENYASEIFKRLDNFSDEDKKKIANCLKDFYEKQGKWTGKVSKKQKEKNAKITEILN